MRRINRVISGRERSINCAISQGGVIRCFGLGDSRPLRGRDCGDATLHRAGVSRTLDRSLLEAGSRSSGSLNTRSDFEGANRGLALSRRLIVALDCDRTSCEANALKVSVWYFLEITSEVLTAQAA